MLLLLQMDITARVEMEMRMAALTETQLTMLEQVGPGLINIYQRQALTNLASCCPSPPPVRTLQLPPARPPNPNIPLNPSNLPVTAQ